MRRQQTMSAELPRVHPPLTRETTSLAQQDASTEVMSAPQFAPHPPDGDFHKRIYKLAEFVLKNGAAFEQMMRQREHQNPAYAFLFGGPGAEYYAWVCYSLQNGVPVHAPPSAVLPSPAALHAFHDVS